MMSKKKITVTSLLLAMVYTTNAFGTGRSKANRMVGGARDLTFETIRSRSLKTTKLFSLDGANNESVPQISQLRTFREAEVLGLRLMQENQIEEALEAFQKGLKLPGSRKDIIRTQTISVSPVGGSAGGREGKVVQTLDEFEIQAAHYNIACAYARLDKVAESCGSLEKAFLAGFDNYAAVRADPDLSSVQGTLEFDSLMEKFDSKKGIFGLFK